MGPRVQGVGGWGGRVFVHLIGRVGVGPAVEQQARHLEVAVHGGNVEARGAVLPASKKEGIKRVGVHRVWACSARWLRACAGACAVGKIACARRESWTARLEARDAARVACSRRRSGVLREKGEGGG
jgi:hypothetical protein